MAQTPPIPPRARQPYSRPQHPTDPLILREGPRQIRFLHPGYTGQQSLLLALPALDKPNGIHHQTALDACAIVAGSRWDGYFTLDREGVQRLSNENMDFSLNADEYYFQVPGGNGNDICKDYPIVPTFAEWEFPHDNLPAHWLRIPALNTDNAGHCLLSNAISLLESAHIVPQNQADTKWFDENGMSVYGPMNSGANTMKLRVDVHHYFDHKPKFAIVPKYDKLVVHVCSYHSVDAREAIELYHNVPVAILGQSTCFLLARFAWTIFPLLEGFLWRGVKRQLLRRSEEGYTIRREDAEGCTKAWLSAKPHSGSPRKRLRNDNSGPQDAYDSDSDYLHDWQEPPRGRKKRRQSFISSMQDSHSTNSGNFLPSGSEVSESVDTKVLETLKRSRV